MVTTTTNSSIQLSDYLLILQSVILTLGLGITVFSIKCSRNDNKNMSTVDLILRQRFNDDLNHAIEIVSDLVKKTEKEDEFPSLLKYFNKDDYPEERKAILTLLNFREFVAVGINTGIINEEIYRRSYNNIMLRDWNYLQNTIYAIRTSKKGQSTNFQDFEMLVDRWKKKPLKKLKKSN